MCCDVVAAAAAVLLLMLLLLLLLMMMKLMQQVHQNRAQMCCKPVEQLGSVLTQFVNLTDKLRPVALAAVVAVAAAEVRLQLSARSRTSFLGPS